MLNNEEKYTLNAEEENKLIVKEYKSLVKSLLPRFKRGDKELLRRAFDIAVDAHKHMRRKSGEPYILHPIAVAKIVIEEIGLGLRSTICALLHDTVEDTDITLKELSLEFGTEITKIIDGLTKISNVVETHDTTQQAENFRKILLTLAEDPRVILIKIADRLHNMRTMDSMSREKQLKISSETTFIYAPLAHRLGLYEIHSELEDLAMKYTETDEYNIIAEKLKNTKKERETFIKNFIAPLKLELDKSGLLCNIYGRSKSISSIYKKIKTKQVSFEEVYDLFAIRIIVDAPIENDKDECWKAYGIVTNLYRPGVGRMRDWISNPKGNGYEALHNTVMSPSGKWVEVQVRSKRMNEIAEKGLAAHWKYKEGEEKSTETKLDDWLKHVREMMQNLDTSSLDFIQDLQQELFHKEMYVYTPKGEMRILPVNATALDFAFDIHSVLGSNCIGAKVNFKLVPLNHVLKSGDQIEIITSKKQKPHEDWLKFVITGKAKSRIKYYLKEEKRTIAEDGKAALERKMKSLNFPINTQNINELCAYFKLPSSLDLHYKIAIGAIDLKDLKKFVLHGDKIEIVVEKKLDVNIINEELELTKHLPGKGSELILFGESSKNIKYKLANCCNPINGDDVFGFVTASEGLKIHRTNCPNATSLMASYGHRVVKAKWAHNKSLSFLTAVRIIGLDDVGVINKITNVISGDLKINMRSMSIESNEGIFKGTVTIFVHNKEQLNLLCEKLQSLDGIQKVTRLEIDDEE